MDILDLPYELFNQSAIVSSIKGKRGIYQSSGTTLMLAHNSDLLGLRLLENSVERRLGIYRDQEDAEEEFRDGLLMYVRSINAATMERCPDHNRSYLQTQLQTQVHVQGFGSEVLDYLTLLQPIIDTASELLEKINPLDQLAYCTRGKHLAPLAVSE